jgi:hypothetical protein
VVAETALPPTVTIASFVNPVPVIVILVPPAVGPDEGLTLVIVGASARAMRGIPVFVTRKIPGIREPATKPRHVLFFIF